MFSLHITKLIRYLPLSLSWATLMVITSCGIAKQPPTKAIISQEGLCFFNYGTDTYLHPGNGSYLAIDLTVTDPSLFLDFSWK